MASSLEHGDAELDPRPHRPSRRGLVVTAAIAVIVVSGLIVAGVVPRLGSASQAREDRARAAGERARIQVEKPARQPGGGSVLLPGTVQAVQDAVVYARTTGYVRSFTVDIGDTVKAGQVLATLETPEVDQELRAAEAQAVQARANIEQAKTQLALADTESHRYQALAGSGVVSQQDMEEHRASFDARSASLHAAEAARGAAEANLQRLRELKGFATVGAPFDGVITARNVELGQLVTAGTSQAMFRVANTSVVRIFVNVPQVYASAVKVGDAAKIHLRELPNRPFTGQVTRSSHALDPGTRTLLTEIRIPNPDGALLPGMYAQLALAVSRVDAPLLIRPSELVADAVGTRVAVVLGGAIHWRAVHVDSDLGDQVAILSGLEPSDDVVVAPSERLAEGLLVTAEPAKPQPAPGAGSAAGAASAGSAAGAASAGSAAGATGAGSAAGAASAGSAAGAASAGSAAGATGAGSAAGATDAGSAAGATGAGSAAGTAAAAPLRRGANAASVPPAAGSAKGTP